MSDYINYAIQKLTPTAIFFSIAFLFELLSRRIERGLSETQIAALTKNPKKTMRARRRPFVFIILISIAATIINTILFFLHKVDQTELYKIYKGTLPILWIAFAFWYTSEPRLTLNWPRKWVLCFYFLPALMILTFISGLYSGASQLRTTTYNENIILSNETIVKTHVIITLDKYLILKEEGQDRIKIIPTVNIASIEMKTSK